MYRLYRITLKQDGTEDAQRDEYENVTQAEGAFEFQKGLAMETGTFTFLMLLDNIGKIHNGYITKIGDGTLKPRLYEVKTTNREEAKSYVHNDTNSLLADFWKRIGGAKQTEAVKAEMLRAIDENGSPLEYSYWVRPIEPVEQQEEEQPQGE